MHNQWPVLYFQHAQWISKSQTVDFAIAAEHIIMQNNDHLNACLIFCVLASCIFTGDHTFL